MSPRDLSAGIAFCLDKREQNARDAEAFSRSKAASGEGVIYTYGRQDLQRNLDEQHRYGWW